MEIKVGADILSIPEFKKSFQRYPGKFRRDIFCASELKDKRIEHLAGIFAAKEAVMKALDMRAGNWRLIEVKHFSSGKPFVTLSPELERKKAVSFPLKKILSSDISISHHGDYAIAVSVFLLSEHGK